MNAASTQTRAGKRYSALVLFRDQPMLVRQIRAHDVEHARKLLDGRRDAFFRIHGVPPIHQRTWRVLGLFYGTARFATE